MSGPDRFPVEVAEIRLATWHRRSVYIVLVVVAVTGIVWTLCHDLFGLAPNAFERVTLELHAAAAFFSLAALGSLAPHHIRLAWNARRNRISGALVLAGLLVLVGSAYALYYAGEDLRDVMKWIHIAIGIAITVGVPLHIVWGRRAKFE